MPPQISGHPRGTLYYEPGDPMFERKPHKFRTHNVVLDIYEPGSNLLRTYVRVYFTDIKRIDRHGPQSKEGRQSLC